MSDVILPFGRHKGKPLSVVWEIEKSYLCWFVYEVEGCQDLKDAMLTLPTFDEEYQKYLAEIDRRKVKKDSKPKNKPSNSQPASPVITPADLDALCDHLFNGD